MKYSHHIIIPLALVALIFIIIIYIFFRCHSGLKLHRAEANNLDAETKKYNRIIITEAEHT